VHIKPFSIYTLVINIRSFAVETIQQVIVLPEKAQDIAGTDLNAHFTSAYGIFAGQPTLQAALNFSPERARWVQF
jgi:hypothetical protein